MILIFFFNDTATTEIYTLSLHDALPISSSRRRCCCGGRCCRPCRSCRARQQDRKSTRLNSSHVEISYAVFCLKKKKELNAVIHLLMEAKHWGLRKSRNATSINSRFKSLDTLKVKIISVTFRRVIRTNHKKASKIWRHENIQLGGCQS